MALTATIRTLELDLADADRGVYTQVEQRLAQHPSETDAWLVTRVLAYALAWTPDLTFGRGVSATDEPALARRDPTGRWLLWLDVGAPAGERLHRAAKLADQVAVYTDRSPADLRRRLGTQTVHRAEAIEVVRLPASLIEPLVAGLGRRNRWSVVRSGGTVWVEGEGIEAQGEPVTTTLAAL